MDWLTWSLSTWPGKAAIGGGILAVLSLVPSAAAQYSARTEGDIVRLEDSGHRTRVSIVPSVGNVAFEMRVNGENILRFPYADITEFRGRPGLNGIPFLAPWANRLDEQAFYANGKRYAFNMDIGNVRGLHPIHGFLSFTDRWRVTELKADNKAAWIFTASRPGWPNSPSPTPLR